MSWEEWESQLLGRIFILCAGQNSRYSHYAEMENTAKKEKLRSILVLDMSFTLSMFQERGLLQALESRKLNGYFGRVISVHPLAGMGLNLGISDIIEIVNITNSNSLSFNNKNFYSKYARKQKIINKQARRQLKFIEKIYSMDNKLAESIIKNTMSAIQKSGFVKKKIIEHANNNLSFF